ncbi:unnamed protein product [Paramecium primaurelia]|uniref:Uncharacterized protein n=1 Tax=Paramecium primaurelia TaxID=5886 RepID=A0A8S1P122_PARPR|nr:unnamed protein product [Paramecium primaurelia]
MIIKIIEYLIGKKRKIKLALHKIQQETQFYKIQVYFIRELDMKQKKQKEYLLIMISIRDILEIIVNSIIIVIQNGSSILAPVNFDLAYCKEEIINIDFDFDTQISNSQTYQENKNYDKFDLEQWLFYQDQERIGLELAIGGMDMILAIHMFQEKQKTNIEEFFEILLRDQMRIGYLEGMQLKVNSSLFYQRMDQIQVIIKEALTMTQDIIS